MAIKVMADNNQNIDAKQDAAMYYYLSGYVTHDIFKGVDNEMKVDFSGLKATLCPGGAFVYGHHVFSDGKDSISLPTSTTCYLVIRVDMSQPAGHEASFTTVATLRNENLLATGKVYDIPLYKLTTSATAVTSQTDLRNLKTRDIVFYTD